MDVGRCPRPFSVLLGYRRNGIPAHEKSRVLLFWPTDPVFWYYHRTSAKRGFETLERTAEDHWTQKTFLACCLKWIKITDFSSACPKAHAKLITSRFSLPVKSAASFLPTSFCCWNSGAADAVCAKVRLFPWWGGGQGRDMLVTADERKPNKPGVFHVVMEGGCISFKAHWTRGPQTGSGPWSLGTKLQTKNTNGNAHYSVLFIVWFQSWIQAKILSTTSIHDSWHTSKRSPRSRAPNTAATFLRQPLRPLHHRSKQD